jgi:glycosyltransferase involved in cell wall biosynthesis
MSDLSIVIIGRNAEWSISRLLDSVIACVPLHLSKEIIYVDSASTDRTIEVVSRYPTTIIQLSADHPLCASAGRFIGSRYATGKYIYFLDSDMELLDGWLERALLELDERPQIGVITGIVVDTDRALKTDQIPPIDYSSYSDAGLTDVQYAGGAAIFRRSILHQVGTWNPHIISDEESELCLRIRQEGYRVVCLEYPMTRHHTAPYFEISTLIGRRKRGLYVGFGQTIRCFLHDKLLVPYLIERGYGLLGLVALLLGIGSVGMSLALHSAVWCLGFVGLLTFVILLDSIRMRSFSHAFFHVLHRALILEGTVKGFLMRPHRREEYLGKVTIIKTAQ